MAAAMRLFTGNLPIVDCHTTSRRRSAASTDPDILTAVNISKRQRPDGVNLFLADGEAAFQEIFHVHLDVFPRFPGDNFRIDADWRPRDRGELDQTAAAVRAGWNRLIDPVRTPAPS